MNILITGSGGTIGNPLFKRLHSMGHTVYGCDLKHSSELNYTRCDISEYRQVRSLFNNGIQFDLVYHLAAEFGRMNGEHYYEQLWKTNVIGTRNILELQKELGFNLVFTSSSEIYNGIDEGILHEDILPEMQRNDYSITKWVNEIQCRNFRLKYNVPIMILRLFNIYGPGEFYNDYRSVIALFCYRAMFNKPYTVYKNCSRTFLYVDDFVDTASQITTNFYDGEIINLSGIENTNIKDLNTIILKTLNLTDELVVYKEAEEFNVSHKYPSNEKAIRLLKHSPKVNLQEGITRTITWMKHIYEA
jgi:dTDP-glucose 4,6-dehydratase